jgi:hypothetical protein
VIANHFDSKDGDDPLYGPTQPPVLSSAVQRQEQAQIVHDFVAQALSLDPTARVLVLGDFNDYQFSTPLQVLDGQSVGAPILTDLAAALLPDVQRYGYVYEGNSEELDHIYVSNALLADAQFQPIHVNSEFANQASDHDPLLSSLYIPSNVPPVANAGNNQTVNAGASVQLSASASTDSDGSIISYAWTQTSGTPVSLTGANTATASFTAPSVGGDLVFKVIVTDNDGATASASVTITVIPANLPPIANAGPDQTVTDKFRTVVTLNGSASYDPDGSIAAYQWTQTSGPSVTLTGATTSTASFTAASRESATLVFQLTVTDNQGAQASDSVTITLVKPVRGRSVGEILDGAWLNAEDFVFGLLN